MEFLYDLQDALSRLFDFVLDDIDNDELFGWSAPVDEGWFLNDILTSAPREMGLVLGALIAGLGLIAVARDRHFELWLSAAAAWGLMTALWMGTPLSFKAAGAVFGYAVTLFMAYAALGPQLRRGGPPGVSP